MSPRMRVARFSFLRAMRRFSRSGSRGFWTRGTVTPPASWSRSLPLMLPPPPLPPPLPLDAAVLAASSERRAFVPDFFPKIGWHRRSLRGLTTAHRLTTPESELLGSNSLTMSVSMPTDGCLARANAAACCCSSPFTDSVDPRNWHCSNGLRTAPTPPPPAPTCVNIKHTRQR